MKVLPILVLLSLAALQLCSADVKPVTCSEDNAAAAANLAVHHINMHHEHGYKFRLSEIQGNKTEKVDDGCNIELHLDILETTCHTVNPKPFEDCQLRSETSRAVVAHCNVTISVKNDDAEVTEYDCDTRQVLTNREMARLCPDCPVLIALNSTEGLKAVDSIVETFNKNTSNQHYYVLHEVGRILSGYIPSVGMMYYPEVVLVETRCPFGSRIAIQACKPLCPDRAHHALCSASSQRDGQLGKMDCEFYPPKNTTALGPDEKEPVCKRHHHGPPGLPGPPGPPGHAAVCQGHGNDRGHGQGNDNDHGHGKGQGQSHGHGKGQGQSHGHAHGHSQGHGHAHGHGIDHPKGCAHGNDHGPGHGHGRGPPPRPFPFHPCHGVLTNVDPALHPICPWPHPEPPPNPRES